MAFKGFEIDEKTGFEIVGNDPVLLLDYRGKEFYNTVDIPKVKRFNLPAGKYFIVSGRFRSLQNPVYFPLNKLPFRQRFFKNNPRNFKIHFRNNPHKAVILWKHKVIVFDHALKNYLLPELYYILFHEYAHEYYNNETLTDALAENYMIIHGFNPSQVSNSLVTSLNPKQIQRKMNTVNRLIKRT